MMRLLMLLAFSLAVLTYSISASSVGGTNNFQVNTDELLDGYDVTIARRGNDSEVRLQDKYGISVTKYIFLAAQQLEIEIPAAKGDCYVRRTYEKKGFGLDCEYKQLMTPEEVTDVISQKCGPRNIYAVRPDQCTDENQRSHGHGWGCWFCWLGICCGSYSW